MTKITWTVKDIPDLSGKVIIVTGGNSGLGYESVKAFAEKGVEVILACRDLTKGESAKSQIEAEGIAGKIVVMLLDLMDLESIKSFAHEFKTRYTKLDVLLNNAGIMMSPYFLTKNGFEGQMGTNHLGHFALTGLLLDLIIKTPKSRVINVSSAAHKSGKMDFDNLLFEGGKDYSRMGAYGRSKISNLLFTYELQRQFESHGLTTLAVAAHPGGSSTNLGRYFEGKLLHKILWPLIVLAIQPPAMGALPQIRAAVDPDVKGGQYWGPDGFKEVKGYPVLVQSNEASHNQEDARKLWEMSEKLTQVRYLFPIARM